MRPCSRERNKIHARRSRLRKKALIESLRRSVEGMRAEVTAMRKVSPAAPAAAADCWKNTLQSVQQPRLLPC